MSAMSVSDMIEHFRGLAQKLADGETISGLQNLPVELQAVLERRATFMKNNTKVRRAIMLRKILKRFEDMVRGGVQKVAGCKRFGPRKQHSTLRKGLQGIIKIEATLTKRGFPEFEIKELQDRVKQKIGGKL